MNYYLDCEFDGFGGPLLSMALIREDNESIYMTFQHEKIKDPWVEMNVMPIMKSIPSPLPGMAYFDLRKTEAANKIYQFMKYDPYPCIIVDWPDDIRYFCESIITGPGYMIGLNALTFELVRVDAWPNKIKNAVQHNAWWDAQALRVKIEGLENE